MCELGLRAGASGTKRLIARNELRRGLKALSFALAEMPLAEGATGGGEDGGGQEGRREGEQEAEGAAEPAAAAAKVQAGRGRRGGGWSESEVNDLLSGVTLLGSDVGDGGSSDGGGGGRGGYEADLTDVEFRERLVAAIAGGGAKEDRDVAAAQEISPLAERLEVP